MNSFPSAYSRKASKHILRLDAETNERIERRITLLEQDTFPQEVEHVDDLKGEKVYRVRAGKLRILYIVRQDPRKLIIINVDKRSRVYER